MTRMLKTPRLFAHLTAYPSDAPRRTAVCVAAVVAASLLAGCASKFSQSLSQETTLGSNEGLVILAAPLDAEVQIVGGTLQGGRFVPGGSLRAGGAQDVARGGYFIAKLKALPPGQGYGVTHLRLGNRDMSPACGQPTVFFNVIPGEPQYLGEVAYNANPPGLQLRQPADINALSLWLRASMPRITRSLVRNPAQTAEQTQCTNLSDPLPLPVIGGSVEKTRSPANKSLPPVPVYQPPSK